MAIASEEAVLLDLDLDLDLDLEDAAKAFAILIVDQEQTRTKIIVEEVKRGENIMLLYGYVG
jgi:hypothetical protein